MGTGAHGAPRGSFAASTILGSYQVTELIAKGGMAEVYKAKRYGAEGFEKTLVLKRILPEYSKNPEFIAQFINEAKIAMYLNHTNIVQVLDLSQEGGEYFIAMEYVYGMNLSELIRRTFALGLVIPSELIAFVASEVAKGLDFAHRRRGPDMRPLGIVHRDISPQNVLLSFEGEVKITDFGIAAARHVISQEQEGYVKGKLAYMSPEQALGEQVDGRTDIFALGVIAYEMASGQNPFRQSTSSMTIERIIKHEFVPLSQKAPHVPEELAAIVDGCLVADPEKRCPNAGRLYEELLAFIYTTGKRVSSHTLAQFLGDLREQAGRPVDEIPLDASIEEVINLSTVPPPGAAGQGDLVDTTNVAIPVAGKAGAQAEEEHRTDLSVEQRDCTLMSVEHEGGGGPGAGEGLPRVDQVVEGSGGRIVEAAAGSLAALFGMADAGGRDTEAAVRCALRIRHVARTLRQRENRIVPVGVCIKPLRLSVDAAGTPIEDAPFLRALVETREIAQRHADEIVVTGVKPEDLDEKFEIERAPAADPALAVGSFLVRRERLRKAPAAKFIDRRAQLQEMAEPLAAASRGSGRVVGITGDPGIGKSRFIEEIHNRLRQKSGIFWYQTACLAQHQSIPLSAVLAMVRTVTGIGEDDAERQSLDKIGRLRELGASNEEIETAAHLLGVTSERSTSFDTSMLLVESLLVKIARKLSQERLTILAWESCRYMDAESRTVLESLAAGIAHARVLVLLTYRGGAAARPIAGHRFKEITLTPLSDADCTKLIMELLGQTEDLPWELLTELITKSGGNPLFMEEYLKAMKLSGAITTEGGKVAFDRELAQGTLPKSLKGIFIEYMAKLSEESRGLLKVASVIGSRFGADVLSEVVGKPMLHLGQMMDGLEREGILCRSSLMEYSFQHDFFREAVYDSLPHAARKSLHEKVAAAIEASPAGRMEEVYQALAHHWRESGNRRKAIEYLLKSADRFAAIYHYVTALQQYLKASDLVRNSPTAADTQLLLDIYNRIGEMAILSARTDLGIEKMKLAADLAEELGDRRRLVHAVTTIGKLATSAGKFSDAQRNFSRALELSEGLTDVAIRRDILGSIGVMHAKNGEYLQAAGFLEEALKLARQTGDVGAQHGATRQLATTCAALGRREQAMAYLEEAEKQAQDKDDMLALCEMYKTRALVPFMLREFDLALIYSEKALELAKEYNFTYEIAVNAHNMGDVYVRQHNFKKAFTALQFSYEVSKENGFQKLEVINMALMGYIDAVRFGSTEGIEKIRSAIKYAAAKQYSWDVVQGKYFLGKAHRELKEYKEAVAVLKEAIATGRSTGNIMYVEDSEKLLAEIEQTLNEKQASRE